MVKINNLILGCCKMMICVSLLLTVSGCPVTIVSKYDEQTDKDVTALQKKLDAFVLKLEGMDDADYPKCGYNNNKQLVEDSYADLSSIKVRAEAIPQNDITLQQLDALSTAMQSFEGILKLNDKNHKCTSKKNLEVARTGINQIFTAILRFEIAKKREGK